MSASNTNIQEFEDKNKASEVVEMSMDEAESSGDEDYEEETVDPNVMEEDDGMEEIDPSNIIQGGRRTRGKVIDFSKAAAETPADDEDEDDEDFQENNMEED